MFTAGEHRDGSPQRVRVEVPEEEKTNEVKILLQRFDENLGWYTANSMNLPRCQIPLLQQAIERLNSPSSPRSDNVIPFPSVCS